MPISATHLQTPLDSLNTSQHKPIQLGRPAAIISGCNLCLIISPISLIHNHLYPRYFILMSISTKHLTKHLTIVNRLSYGVTFEEFMFLIESIQASIG